MGTWPLLRVEAALSPNRLDVRSSAGRFFYHLHLEVDPMSSDSSSPRHTGDSSHDGDRRPAEVRATWDDGSRLTTHTYSFEPPPPSFRFEHDKQKRLFILTWPDGKTERFRDNPARHLMVEPDPDNGEMRPVIKGGQPVYVNLCREERELL
jgi:hypothetical protein